MRQVSKLRMVRNESVAQRRPPPSAIQRAASSAATSNKLERLCCRLQTSYGGKQRSQAAQAKHASLRTLITSLCVHRASANARLPIVATATLEVDR